MEKRYGKDTEARKCIMYLSKGKAIQPSSWNENSHKRITEDKLRQQAGPDVEGVECWPDGFGESLKFLIWVVM